MLLVLLMTSGCGSGEDKGPKAIVVWNPFVIATLASREDVVCYLTRRRFRMRSSTRLWSPSRVWKSRAGRRLHSETFYEVNKAMADSAKAMTPSIGQKFAAVSLEDMEKVVKQTKFYGTPDELPC